MNEKNNTGLVPVEKVSVKQLLEPNGAVIYLSEGNVEVSLTMNILSNLVKRPQDAPEPTQADMLMFAYACVSQGLNPYLQDCWLVWMGQRQGWTPLVAAQSRVRKAQSQADYRGYEWGWITADGTRHEAGRKSTVKAGGDITGIWGQVLRENRAPYYHEIFAAEYPPKSGQKPLTMLLKINRDQTHKFAYADKMGNLMTENEAHYVERDNVLGEGEPKSAALLAEEPTKEARTDIPEPHPDITEENNPPMTEAEVEAHLKDKLQAKRYRCNNSACDAIFDDALKGKGKDGAVILVCPVCNFDDVTDYGEPQND